MGVNKRYGKMGAKHKPCTMKCVLNVMHGDAPANEGFMPIYKLYA